MSRLTGNKPENCSVLSIYRTIPTTKLTFSQRFNFQEHNLLTVMLLMSTILFTENVVKKFFKRKTVFYMSQDEADAAAAANLALFEIVEVRDGDRQVVVGDVQMHSARRRRSSASPVAARRYHVVLHVPAQLSAFALTSSLTSITGSGYSDCVASLPLRNAGFTLNLTNGSGPDSEGHSGARPPTLVSFPNNHIKKTTATTTSTTTTTTYPTTTTTVTTTFGF